MNKLMIPNPLTGNENTIQNVLCDLAAQEGCDGEPYDQMVIAAAYIDYLEACIQQDLTHEIIIRLKHLVDKIKRDGVLYG